jgi:hypothetical protein
MRKYLLASAAVLGGLFHSGLASAQSVTSPALLPDARGMAGSVNPADSAVPAPGSVVVRFGGQMDWMAATFTDTNDRSPSPLPGQPNTGVKAKEANYSFGDYIRLFPSVDGQAANGLRYGAFAEFRVENYLATGGGANGGVSAADRTNNVYVRRAWGYLGLRNAGTLRFGLGDGVGQLFDTGSFQNFDAGGWNGDVPNLFNGNSSPTFPFQAGVGAFYSTDKLTYLSPQLYGLEFGVSYEPNTSNGTNYNASSATSTVGTGVGLSSIALSGSSIANQTISGAGASASGTDIARRRNTINPGVRYRNTFGPIGVALEASYDKSALIGYDGVSSTVQRYKGWDYGNYGVVLTYGGLSVGGQIMYGDFSGQGNTAKQGARKSFAWIAGTSYTVGPVIVGASFFQYYFNNHGDFGDPTIGTERDRGVAVGGTYTVTPGVSIMLSYLYGDKKETGYDMVNGHPNTASSFGESAGVGNKIRTQGLGTEVQIKW